MTEHPSALHARHPLADLEGRTVMPDSDIHTLADASGVAPRVVAVLVGLAERHLIEVMQWADHCANVPTSPPDDDHACLTCGGECIACMGEGNGQASHACGECGDEWHTDVAS